MLPRFDAAEAAELRSDMASARCATRGAPSVNVTMVLPDELRHAYFISMFTFDYEFIAILYLSPLFCFDVAAALYLLISLLMRDASFV